MIATRTSTRPIAQALDRMGALSRMLDQVQSDRAAAPMWVPPLEVVERADAYLIAVDLPGVREEQLDLSFENNVLTLRGTKEPTFAPALQAGETRVHVLERLTGAFERSVRLPEYVEGDRIEARFENGVLLVTVPKARAAQRRKIPVTTAATRATEIGAGESHVA